MSELDVHIFPDVQALRGGRAVYCILVMEPATGRATLSGFAELGDPMAVLQALCATLKQHVGEIVILVHGGGGRYA